MEAGALLFSQAARRLGAATRAAALTVPAFRCPPRVAGALRTIRRYPGGAVVAVRLQGRPFSEVASDMVEGVLAVNRLEEAAAAGIRPLLRQAVEPGVDQPAAA
ncbi:MAG TPA: hypothetical protein VKI01_11140 [Acidimicrobiia bacterium]|nr:hypothetical protein [Acidimicrobiia bacterium]